ncbi:hypothetical protein A2U01_0112406, partial [Trifolium medium]|nr:hypothetical protein [Trifolium medium]
LSCGPGAFDSTVLPSFPRTPQQVVSEPWFGLVGELAGVDPDIGSTIGCGNSHLGEIVGFQV